MPVQQPVQNLTPSSGTHPICPNCGVAMWLVRVEHGHAGSVELDLCHFECKACGEKAITPPL